MLYRFCLLSVMMYSVIATTTQADVVVNTTYGAVKGKAVVIVNNQTVFQFLKLPFAKPPLGKLRFQKPERPNTWTGTLEASHHGPPCMQKLSSRYKPLLENANVSEDCLYLNVYVPRRLDQNASLAVMVYIHGGAFRAKTASLQDGSYLALKGDVIVVLTNFRLGFFGFFSTEDDAAKGNYGLWDQIYALRWIQENINVFGGDTTRVTVFGHSSGGYSIGLLLFSTQTQHLFRRAIAMSGFGTSPRAITYKARQAALRLATKLGCFNGGTAAINTSVMTECVRIKPASDLLNGQNKIVKEDSSSPQFIMRPAPVIDGEILNDNPVNIINDFHSEGYKRFLSADYMAGTNSADGGLVRNYLKVIQTQFNFSLLEGAPTSALCESIAPALSRDYYTSNINISNMICEKYASSGSLADQAIRMVNLIGDMWYDSRAVQTLRRHILGNTKSYQFIFSHKSSFEILSGLPPWLTGAYHGDEVVYTFGMPAYAFTASERLLSDTLMTYLTNFAKFG